MNSNANPVSQEKFIDELKSAEIKSKYILYDQLFKGKEDDDGQYPDAHEVEYRSYYNEMDICGVTLKAERDDYNAGEESVFTGDDAEIINDLEKLNVVDADGDKLSVEELDEILREQKSNFVFVPGYENHAEAQSREERIAEARARAQRAAAGAAPVGTATATAATATPTTAPRQ